MYEQKLYDYKRAIPAAKDVNELESEVELIVTDDYVYSYIVHLKCNNEYIPVEYVIKYMVSDEEENNTIPRAEAIVEIIQYIIENKDYKGKSKVIGYRQPPLDLMIVLYEPVVMTMSLKLREYWQQYELEDLEQICRICMVELYNAGYYIHKRLLWTVFSRKILEEVRGLKKRACIVSIYEDSYENSKNEKHLTYADSLIDESLEIRKQEDDRLSGEMEVFEEIKGLIIDLVGERRWDMLYRDYSRKHTTDASRKLLQKIKTHLKELGITRNQFNERYH